MTKLKLLSAALIAAAVLAAPAMARETHTARRHASAKARITPASGHVYGRACVAAPRVGAFATQPWDNATPCEPVRSY